MPKPEDNVRKLMELGHTKSKSQKALKECNNNFQQAKVWLERSKEAEDRKLREATLEQKAKEAPRKPKPKEATSAPVRRHPCVVQYGKCRYGAKCMFRQLPGDTCINYVTGSCIFGDYCRNRHAIDGVDIRKLMAPEDADDTEYVVDGSDPNVLVALSGQGKVLSGTKIFVGSTEDQVVPDEAVFAADAAGVATYSEPIAQPVFESVPQDVPQPFLQKVNAAPASPTLTPVTQVVRAPKPEASAQQVRLHPCVVQCGECRFGPTCKHAQVRADVCVHWLNGICRFETGCRYKHQMIIPTPAEKKVPPRDNLWSPAVHEDSDAWNSFQVPSMEPASDKQPPPPTAFPRLGAEPERPPPPEQAADERRAFNSLSEVFPQVSPDLLLFALRRHGNDREKVAQMVVDFSPDRVEDELKQFGSSAQMDEDYGSITLLTLCDLLPNVEPSTLQALLSQCGGDFAGAYSAATCTMEHLVQSDRSNQWNNETATPAQRFALDRLRAMFPKASPELVERCFVEADHSTRDALALLHVVQQTEDELTLEERDQLATAATTQVLAADDTTQHVVAPSSNSFVVTESSEPIPSTAHQTVSTTDLYKRTISEADSVQDWRRTRHEAYLTNAARLQCIGLAIAAYKRSDHKVGRSLISRARQLHGQYSKLNMLAMHALERERATSDAPNTLDLHGFHGDEAADVLVRRVKVVVRSGGGVLRIVVGAAKHSHQGHSVVVQRAHEVLKSFEAEGVLRITSIKQAEIHVRVSNVKPRR